MSLPAPHVLLIASELSHKEPCREDRRRQHRRHEHTRPDTPAPLNLHSSLNGHAARQ
ncbi:hypothetical protein ACOZ38_41960 [Sphaerisporangium viridialbum]|uniref:hypothetical protein n=1 Tax=Sphaerisporangium viridialbum TaxID=46189 RepID=UPI003C7070A4